MSKRRSKLVPGVSAHMRELAKYIAGATGRALPAEVVEKTKHHVLDTVAAMVSGSRLPAGRAAISYVRTLGGTKDAIIVGTRIVTGVVNAALANGMLAHADETDDSHSPSFCHPGCGIVSAALATADFKHRPGDHLLRAVALGYDIGTRLNMALDAKQYRADGHSTHSIGPTFGAAAAAGALMGLDYDGARYLLSYAAQQASGVSCWMRDQGHIEKAFDFGGMPARNGVTAATMVAHGFTAVDDVFSGERNFFVANGRKPRIGELVRELGTRYEIVNTNIKRWSVGSPIQAPLDSLVQLIRLHHIDWNQVDHVVVRVSHQGANTVDNRSMPDICMQHLCALMLLDGTITFESAHDEKRMRDPRVLQMRRRVELRGDDELERLLPSRQAVVEIRLRDGRRYTHHTKNVRGTAENPMNRAEVIGKCLSLIAMALGKQQARRACDAILAIEQMKDVRELRPLLKK